MCFCVTGGLFAPSWSAGSYSSVYLLSVPLHVCIMLFSQGRQSALQGVDDGQPGLQLLSVTPHTLFHLHLSKINTILHYMDRCMSFIV